VNNQISDQVENFQIAEGGGENKNRKMKSLKKLVVKQKLPCR